MSKKKEMSLRINPGDILDTNTNIEEENVKEIPAEEAKEEKTESACGEHEEEPAAAEKKHAHKNKKKHKKAKISALATENAPAAIGPYSQAVIAGNILFASGQIPADPKTGAIVGITIAEQAEQAMKNVAAILDAAGTDFDHVVKTTCFLKDMADFAAFNEVYASYFTGNKPARSCVAVCEIPKGVLCVVEVTAFLK